MAEYSNTDNATVITGSAEADSITNSGATVTVSALGGDDTIDNTGSKVTIDAGADDDSITNTGSNVSILGGAGNNAITINDGTGVTVNVASGNDTIYIGNDVSSITVKDFGEDDEIQFIGGAITNFSTTSGGVIADDVTIAGLTAATSTQKWSGKTKYVETVTKGASLSSYGNSIVYTPASETTLFTISGITSTSNVTVDTDDNTVTIGAGALTTSNVSISSGYTLVLGDDVEAPTTDSGWSVSGTTYAYKETSTIAGYELDTVNNQIIYTPATNGATLVQLSGLKSEPYIDGNNIMLSADNFSTNVTVNSNANGYAFNLNTDNYSKKSFTGTANADSIYNSGSSIIVNGANGDDYTFNNGSQVTINAGNGDDTIVNDGDNISINGGAGDDSIDFNSGDNVTINVASGNDTINLGNVTSFVVQSFSSGDAIQLAALADSLGTVSGGITAGNVTISGITSLSTASNQLSLRSGVATYYTKITAGATLNEDNDAIIYTAASTSNLFTLRGVTSTVGIDVSDSVVTVSESALGTSNVSISSDDYKLALGSNVSSSSIADAWLQSGTAYAYGLSSTITGYDLDQFNNVINYTANKVGTTVVELTNIDISDNAPTVSTDSAKISLSADSFSGNVSVKSNSGNYKFELGEGSYSKRTFSGSANADSIYNDGSALSINGGAGDDFINNESSGSSVTISGGAGNDTISNIASNVTISGDAGADSISNLGDSVSINAGAGADSIYNSGDNVTILGDADNDNVYNNSGESVLFQYKGGNDTITGFGSTDTLQIVSGSITSAYSDGYNAFLTVGKNVLTIETLSTTTSTINVMNSKGSVSAYKISLVKGTDEDDSLLNYNDNVTIDALAGNDYVSNYADSVTIAGGADNDTIDSYGSALSINGGTGDDSININSGSNIVINVTEGNDTISIKNDNASISVEDFYSGDAIVLSNAIGALSSTSDGIIAGNVTISGLSIASVSSDWSLDGSDAHYVETYSTGVALGADKTSITYKADGEQTTLFTVTGVKDTAGLALNDDTIVVSSAALNQKDITVDNNYILSLGADVSAPEIVAEGWFNSGGNYVYRSTSTVAGYRSVSDNEIYYYDNAGGSALVELSGVGSEPNLSGNSVMLAAENFSGNVAVVSNANEYSFDLSSDDYEGKTFTATAKADTITNSGSNIGIISGNGNDSIDNYGENVTVNAGAGSDSIDNRGENASINTGAGDDSIYNYGDLAIINAGAGNDNIENYGYSATISAGAGDDTVANYNNANDILFQYSGGNDVIEGFNDSSTLKISSGAISSAYFRFDSTDVFIAVGENTITLKDLATNKINLMTADDTVSSEYFIPILMGTNDPDNIQNDNYSHLEIQALAGDDTINNSGASVTIDGGADNDTITNSGSFVSINGGAGDDSIEISYSSDVTVNVANGNDTIAVSTNISSFTVQEFSSGDRIELNTSATEMTSTKGGIIIDGDLTINGLTASNVTNEWSLESGVAKYYENRTAGVTLIDNDSAIVATVAGTTDIFTISGVVSTVGIDVDDTSVTVSASALGTSNVSISSGYFLALGDDVASPEAVLEGWQVNGTTYTYKADSTLAGYELDGENNQIIYTPETGGETLVKISGIKNEPVFNGNSIVLSAEDFSTNVTVNSNANGYDFDLSQADYSGKSFIGTSGNDSIYNSGSNIMINAGAGNNIINNYGFSSTITAGKGNDSVVNNIYSDNVKISTGAGADSIENYATYASVDAGANNDYITNEGHSSIFNGGAGDDTISNTYGKVISINGGAGNDRIENDADGAILNGNADNDYIYNTGDSATINAGTGNDTIELYLSKDFENIIEYTSGDGDDVITVNSYNGGARLSIDLLSGAIGGYSTTEENDFIVQVDDGSLTFKNSGEEIIKIRTPEGENYIWNGASNTTIGGGDEVNIIDNKGSYMTVQSSKGNDTVTLNADESSSNVYEYSRGKDIIYNYSDTDTIKIAGSSKVKVKINDDDLTLKVGAGSVTLKDAAKNQQLITVVNSADEIIISDTYTTDGKINADATAIELAENFNGTYTAEENITTVDGSNVLNKVRIIGNADYASSLVGGRRNDTLEGSPINSDTLTGGKGSDVFVYKGGPDVITYYEKRDKIRLENESPTVTGYAITGNDLTLGFGSDSLTIADGAGKVITFVQGSKTTRNIYTATGIFDGKQKAVSLSGSQSVFSAAKYSKLVTIDGSAAEDYINITGNSKKNYITAGEFGGTMTGGKGKDTLIASGAFDVFIYDKGDGKDVIEGYDTGDVVSLGSNVEIKDAKISRGNSVIKVASGSITINDTKIATLTSGGNDVIFNNGAFIDNKNSVVKVYGSYSDDISLADFGVTIADASEARKKLTITGDDSANSITGGKGKDSILGGAGNDSLVGGKGKDSLWGGAGNDTLAGGKGNDILYGDAGTDTFIFTAGDGIDTVVGYESGELLSIINKRGKAVDVTKSIFNEEKGTLTLSVKGGGKLILTGVTSSTSVNINDTIKTISDL